MTPHNHRSERSARFRWSASVIGGAVAIGGAAFLGTLCTSIAVRSKMASGATLEQAYAALSYSQSPFIALLSFLAIFAPTVGGGFLAARYSKGKPIAQGAAVGAIAVAFFALMYLNPSSQPGPAWFVVLSLVTPLAAGLLGGALYARRA